MWAQIMNTIREVSLIKVQGESWHSNEMVGGGKSRIVDAGTSTDPQP